MPELQEQIPADHQDKIPTIPYGALARLLGECQIFPIQLIPRLGIFRIEHDAVYRAQVNALLRSEMTDTFGTQLGIDHVDLFARSDRAVWAFGFAYVAVDTFVGD